MYLKSSPGHNIDFRLLRHQGLLWQCQACLLNDGNFARPNGFTTLLCQMSLKRFCCRLTHLLWMRLTRISVTSSRKKPKRLSHAGIETTISYVGMLSVNPFIERSCSRPRETISIWLLQFCLPNLTGSRGIDGLKQFEASTSHTLVEKHGVF